MSLSSIILQLLQQAEEKHKERGGVYGFDPVEGKRKDYGCYAI
jgi:hypothetical protein